MSSITILAIALGVARLVGGTGQSGLVLLQFRALVGSTGEHAELSERGYQHVAQERSNTEMRKFAERLLQARGRTVKNQAKFNGLLQWYSGVNATQTFAKLDQELMSKSWVVDAPELGAINATGTSASLANVSNQTSTLRATSNVSAPKHVAAIAGMNHGSIARASSGTATLRASRNISAPKHVAALASTNHGSSARTSNGTPTLPSPPKASAHKLGSASAGAGHDSFANSSSKGSMSRTAYKARSRDHASFAKKSSKGSMSRTSARARSRDHASFASNSSKVSTSRRAPSVRSRTTPRARSGTVPRVRLRTAPRARKVDGANAANDNVADIETVTSIYHWTDLGVAWAGAIGKFHPLPAARAEASELQLGLVNGVFGNEQGAVDAGVFTVEEVHQLAKTSYPDVKRARGGANAIAKSSSRAKARRAPHVKQQIGGAVRESSRHKQRQRGREAFAARTRRRSPKLTRRAKRAGQRVTKAARRRGNRAVAVSKEGSRVGAVGVKARKVPSRMRRTRRAPLRAATASRRKTKRAQAAFVGPQTKGVQHGATVRAKHRQAPLAAGTPANHHRAALDPKNKSDGASPSVTDRVKRRLAALAVQKPKGASHPLADRTEPHQATSDAQQSDGAMHRRPQERLQDTSENEAIGEEVFEVPRERDLRDAESVDPVAFGPALSAVDPQSVEADEQLQRAEMDEIDEEMQVQHVLEEAAEQTRTLGAEFPGLNKHRRSAAPLHAPDDVDYHNEWMDNEEQEHSEEGVVDELMSKKALLEQIKQDSLSDMRRLGLISLNQKPVPPEKLWHAYRQHFQ